MQEEIKNHIARTLEKLGYPSADFSVDLPKDITHGDFSANVALVLSKLVGKSPMEVAQSILDAWEGEPAPSFAKIEMAGPGFINFHLSQEYVSQEVKKLSETFDTDYSGKKIIIDYTDPNLFKQFHIGHLMANTIGESLSRLFELGGAEVTRICYQGDIGPHVAKCIWGMMQQKDAFPHDTDSVDDKMKFIGDSYVYGSTQFAEDKEIEAEIKEINKKLFEKSDPELQIYYDKGRTWSLEYFDVMYELLGTKFNHFIFETQTAPIGEKVVRDNVATGVFEKSEESDAIIYRGEKDGLHTRVFINSQGLPTYEAKDIGLATIKSQMGDFSKSIIVTGLEQAEYFKVMLAALAQVMPVEAANTSHICHGLLMQDGKKMSSRKGALLAEDLINSVEEKVGEKIAEREFSDSERTDILNSVALSALKYSILKQTPGKNINFDFDKSISFEGDSGPYIQYAYTRARSVLAKAGNIDLSATNKAETYDIEKVLMRFEPIVKRAIAELAPQHVSSYLIELAAAFNSWYAQEKIIGDDNEAYKLLVTRKVAHTLERGLFALGIKAPHKM